ncbi:hypothetical protein [Pseudobacteroides cellulosolvens]|uniref:Uncharacterized protein n=1 Tax=Pseudobacteroides cellulosolvens ATCC 35603 = DSM 2933 TaxID=398512 RepID=A0A0L6JWF1_9FIRM|nr:hypothetical protein [Pseudobacteroides cellulosolvens]KNY30064.1 hypothetical protein Bccel_5341 [Pseudobacteroides cellulosolvens ATCC 35603 = DSM 2933]
MDAGTNARKNSKSTTPGKKGESRSRKEKKFIFERRGFVRLGSKYPKSSFYVEDIENAPIIGSWGIVVKGEVSLYDIAKKEYKSSKGNAYDFFEQIIFDANGKLCHSFSEGSRVFWPVIKGTIYKPNKKLKIPDYNRLSKYPNIENTTKFSYIRGDIYNIIEEYSEHTEYNQMIINNKKGDILIYPKKAFYEEYIYNGSMESYPLYEPLPIVNIDGKYFSVPGRTTMPYMKYLEGYKDTLSAKYEYGPLLYDPNYPFKINDKFFKLPEYEGFVDKHNAQLHAAPKENKPEPFRLCTDEISLAINIKEEIKFAQKITPKNNKYEIKTGPSTKSRLSPKNMVKFKIKSGIKGNLIITFIISGYCAIEEYYISRSFERAAYVFACETAKGILSAAAGIAASWAVAAVIPGIGWCWIAASVSYVVVAYLVDKALDKVENTDLLLAFSSYFSGIPYKQLRDEYEDGKYANNNIIIFGVDIDLDEYIQKLEDTKLHINRFLNDPMYQRDIFYNFYGP